jgi:hypothetical protein
MFQSVDCKLKEQQLIVRIVVNAVENDYPLMIILLKEEMKDWMYLLGH